MTDALFAALFVALYAAHQLGDHVFGQADWMADRKADPGWDGWKALGAHLACYHLVQVIAVGAAVGVLGLPLSPAGAGAGLAVSVASHGLWDRRTPVRWLLVRTRSPRLAALASGGMNGLYLADQSLHIGCLFVAALLAAALS